MFLHIQNQHDNVAQIKEYKAYRNTINPSLRQAKQNCYHIIHNENKGNSKKSMESHKWIGI